MRNDSGVYEGGEISIYYDPMIAKLCTHAADRTHAIDAMGRALDGFYIEGIRHNLPFLSAIMENERWRAGELSTGFIAEEFPEGFSGRALDPELSALLGQCRGGARPYGQHAQAPARRAVARQAGQVLAAPGRQARRSVDPAQVSGDGVAQVFIQHGTAKPQDLRSKWQPGEPVWSGDINGQPAKVQVQRILNGYRLNHRGASVELTSTQSARLLSFASCRKLARRFL